MKRGDDDVFLIVAAIVGGLLAVNVIILISTHASLLPGLVSEMGATGWGVVANFLLVGLTYYLIRVTRGEPHVVIRLVPDMESGTVLNIRITNTGTLTAYNIHTDLDPPDASYERGPTKLSDLDVFKEIYALAPNEHIEFLYGQMGDQAMTEKLTATVTWYARPRSSRRLIAQRFSEEYILNAREMLNTRWIHRATVHDVAKNIEDLRESIMLMVTTLLEAEEQRSGERE